MNFTLMEERLGPLGLPGLLEQLGCEGGRASGCPVPSSSAIIVAGGACVAAYALWEQVKFKLWKATKSGALPGERLQPCRPECPLQQVRLRNRCCRHKLGVPPAT